LIGGGAVALGGNAFEDFTVSVLVEIGSSGVENAVPA